jgi:hypothetical protein
MKRVLNVVGGALGVAALIATIGCDHIRDYSVNSYQGVIPAGSMAAFGASTPPRMTAQTPKPSVPTPAPEAAPSAGGTSAETTKPASSSK